MIRVKNIPLHVSALLMAVCCVPTAAWAARAQAGCGADMRVDEGRPPVYPVTRGDAGPFKGAHVTLIRRAGGLGPFAGRLDSADGRCLPLQGPDDRTGLFDFFVKKILFLPIGGAKTNAIVILYDETHRSPDGDSVSFALVYDVRADEAVRLPRLEDSLGSARSAAEIRRRLRRAHGCSTINGC